MRKVDVSIGQDKTANFWWASTLDQLPAYLILGALFWPNMVGHDYIHRYYTRSNKVIWAKAWLYPWLIPIWWRWKLGCPPLTSEVIFLKVAFMWTWVSQPNLLSGFELRWTHPHETNYRLFIWIPYYFDPKLLGWLSIINLFYRNFIFSGIHIHVCTLENSEQSSFWFNMDLDHMSKIHCQLVECNFKLKYFFQINNQSKINSPRINMFIKLNSSTKEWFRFENFWGF